MKKQFFLAGTVVVLLISIFFSACKKEDGNDNDKDDDLTETVVGRYTNANDYDLEIIVNKIDNAKVSITVKNGYFDYAFTNVTMNTATSFTLNEYTVSSYCYGQGSTEEATTKNSGTGTASNNNISIFVTENVIATAGNCTQNDTYSFSASK